MNVYDQYTKQPAIKYHEIPGHTRLNELLGGGFAQNASHILYAGTGVGKTSMMTDIVTRMLVNSNLRICVISLEESMREIVARISARMLVYDKQKPEEYSYTQLAKANIEYADKVLRPQFQAYGESQRLKLLNISSDVSDIGKIDVLFSEMGKIVYDYDIFFIDHIHLVYSDDIHNENALTTTVAHRIKDFTNTGGTVVALAQMRKTAEISKEPRDFGQRNYESIKGSSHLTQYASSVIHLYKTKSQYEQQEMLYEQKAFSEYQAMLSVEKSRNGAQGFVNYQYNPLNCTFDEMKYDRQHIRKLHGLD
jgi:replicative DNA helicase